LSSVHFLPLLSVGYVKELSLFKSNVKHAITNMIIAKIAVTIVQNTSVAARY